MTMPEPMCQSCRLLPGIQKVNNRWRCAKCLAAANRAVKAIEKRKAKK